MSKTTKPNLWIAYAFTDDNGKARKHETEPQRTKKGARNASIKLIMALADSERVISYGVREFGFHNSVI